MARTLRGWLTPLTPSKAVSLLKQDRKYALVSLAAASLAGIVIRAALRRAWEANTGRPPPADPSSPDVEWREALAWSLASATFVALGRTVATRMAAASWRAVQGTSPPAA